MVTMKAVLSELKEIKLKLRNRVRRPAEYVRWFLLHSDQNAGVGMKKLDKRYFRKFESEFWGCVEKN